MRSIFRYFLKKITFNSLILRLRFKNIEKIAFFRPKYLKNIKFGKWCFDSVLCLRWNEKQATTKFDKRLNR